MSWMKHKVVSADTSLCEVQSILCEYHDTNIYNRRYDVYSTLEKLSNMLLKLLF